MLEACSFITCHVGLLTPLSSRDVLAGACMDNLNVRHVARRHMGTTTLGHGHLASCHEASCHLDKTVKYDILAPLELNANNITNACFIV